MALIPVDKLLDTMNAWIEDQRVTYDSLIDMYYQNRRLNIFLGRRASIPSSSLPSIEISAITDTVGWHACRVQQVEPQIQLDITTDNRSPESSVRLQALMCTLTTRIFDHPAHLLPQIQGTQHHLFDSLLTDVKYDQTASNGSQRVATLSWRGKYLEYLANRLFAPELQMRPPKVIFPPN